eukprot:CAMPEP_0195509370 /NCGR_PEP_ID=MMETSP0794_2-20130614/2321_1 /TAXON_ID=515487 /ORGANISM="Stephanopyxis turris, Strain CCMP 815" /LENGTH=944 /DNA_ID=CAMNT_0040636569 /DNA_START=43 /DNA_END=2877 /DNA_ORIENTATION=-
MANCVVDSAWISTQISNAQSSLDRLEQSSSRTEVSNVEHSNSNNSTKDPPPLSCTQRQVSPEESLDRLNDLSTKVEYLALAQDFSQWQEEYDDVINTTLERRVNGCEELMNICLRVPCMNDAMYSRSCVAELFGKLQRVLIRRYEKLRQSTRCKLKGLIEQSLLSVGYPSEEGCKAIDAQFVAEQEDGVDGDENFAVLATLLWRLQAIHERYLVATSSSNGVKTPWQRMDLVEELCRPIVTRVQYHFSTKGKTDGDSINVLSERYDRLPSWLLTYVRDTMNYPLLVIRHWIDPFMFTLLPTTSGGDDNNDDGEDDEKDTKPSLAEVVVPCTTPASHYFLRDMVFLTRHVLRGGSGKDGSNLLCTILSNDEYLCKFMERVLQFDEYIQNESVTSLLEVVNPEFGYTTNRNENVQVVPHLSGIVTCHPDRFRRWLELEHDYLSSAFSRTLQQEEEDKDSSSSTQMETIAAEVTPMVVDINPSLSSSTEMLSSLLHSSHVKCQLLALQSLPNSNSGLLVEYLNQLHISLGMSYLEALHSNAKSQLNDVLQIMKQQMRPVRSNAFTSWNTDGNNTGTNEFITKLHASMSKWCGMVGGAKVIADLLKVQGLYWQQGKSMEAFQILTRMSDSLMNLANAMEGDFLNAVVECITVDDVSVASYMMRVSHVLQGDHKVVHQQEEEDEIGQQLGAAFSSPPETEDMLISAKEVQDDDMCLKSISPELCEALYVLSIIMHACYELSSAAQGRSGCASDVIAVVAESIVVNLAQCLSSKFVDVALEAPVIGGGSDHDGVGIFQTDMRAFMEVFALGGLKGGGGTTFGVGANTSIAQQAKGTHAYENNTQTSPRSMASSHFDRLLDVIALMKFENTQAVSLRTALRNMVAPQGGMNPNLLLAPNELGAAEQEFFYTTLMDDIDDGIRMEANSMLSAKGFGSIDLKDALMVLNRRRI